MIFGAVIKRNLMNNVFLLTGGNIGDRIMHLQKACAAIEKQVGTILKKSSIYETAAWGLTDQSPFLNQVLQVSTTLLPHEVLQTILEIESKMGRQRLMKLGPRIIDIDILFYGNVILDAADLTIPHPEIVNRRFVLIPMVEISAKFIHPLLMKNMTELEQSCADPLAVRQLLHFPQ